MNCRLTSSGLVLEARRGMSTRLLDAESSGLGDVLVIDQRQCSSKMIVAVDARGA